MSVPSSALFAGCATALITPFKSDNTLDEDALCALIERQLEAGIDAIVLLGTTGEPCTVERDERRRIIQIGVETIAHRVPLIIGTGSNCTKIAAEYAIEARTLGADAQLTVTPYYNKTTQEGLIRHYTSIAKESKLPLILYNVPSRTGMSLMPETVAALSGLPEIIGIKEATGNPVLSAEIIGLTGHKLAVYSGNDDSIASTMAIGACGAVSVCANLCPRTMIRLTHEALLGHYDTAAGIQIKMLPLIHLLFSQVNPIPIKAALSMLGLSEDVLRLPLTKLDDEHRKTLNEILERTAFE